MIKIKHLSRWIHREDLVTANGLVFKGTRLVIPQSIRNELTQRAHASHLGIVYTTNTAREIMYWPGMDADLEEEVRKCESCQRNQQSQIKEPLMTYTNT